MTIYIRLAYKEYTYCNKYIYIYTCMILQSDGHMQTIFASSNSKLWIYKQLQKVTAYRARYTHFHSRIDFWTRCKRTNAEQEEE